MIILRKYLLTYVRMYSLVAAHGHTGVNLFQQQHCDVLVLVVALSVHTYVRK